MAKKKRSVAAADAAGNQHPNKIGIKEGMGYMLGDAGNLFVLTYVSSYLKLFHTDVLGFSGTKSGNLFLITRLWDAINDPLWGMIVSKRKPSKDGKFRPYLKWVSVPLGLSALLCFVDFSKFTQSQILITILAYVAYIAFGMLYTGMNIPFGSLASVITDDPEGRTLLSTFRSIGGGIGGAAPLLLAPLVIFTKSESTGGDVPDGNKMLLFGAIMAVLSITFYMSCYATTKERVPSEENPNVDLKKTYLGLLKSRPFVSVALAGILISGQLQFASLNTYLYKNYFGNAKLSMLGTIANYAPMVIMILLTPKLVKRFGKKELAGTGSFFAAAAAVAMFFVTPHLDRLSSARIEFFALLFVIGFGYSFVSITNWAVVADVIDYQEYKTGLRNESAIYAVYTFCRKLGQTLADVGGLYLLEKFAGYSSDTMKDLPYINAAAPGWSGHTVSDGILFICTLIPAIVYTLVWALMQFGYPLTKERLEPIYAYMREKRGEVEAVDAEVTAAVQ